MKPSIQANILQEYFYQKLLKGTVFDQATVDERRVCFLRHGVVIAQDTGMISLYYHSFIFV